VSCLVFKFYAPELIFSATWGTGSNFQVLCHQTHFRRYRWPLIQFSSFVLPDSFSALSGALGLVFKFCAPGLIFDGIEGVGSRFQVSRSWTHFLTISSASGLIFKFCTPNSFLAVPWAWGLVFKFHTSDLIFGGTKGTRSSF
jgi:hypothetical protein